jgi:hypothetical protein
VTRGSKRRRAGVSLAAMVLGFGLVQASCELGGPQPSRVIAGPAVLSPIPTGAPYAWDTREELDVWINNGVSRGPLALEGDASAAFLRINPASADWVLRGPDLMPAAAVRTVRIRYRWTPDPNLSSSASRTGLLTAYFERLPQTSDQPAAHVQVSPTSDWTEVDLTPGSYTESLRVRYVYFRSLGWNRGIFELDTIQLVP